MIIIKIKRIIEITIIIIIVIIITITIIIMGIYDAPHQSSVRQS